MRSRFRLSLPGAAAAAAVTTGCLVLCGWAFRVRLLTNVLPGPASMKPNTAVGFILLGVAVWALLARPGEGRARWIGQAAALAAGLIGLVTLAEYLLGWDAGIDRVLFPEGRPSFATPHVGRMGANTAFDFTLLGAGLLTMSAGRLGRRFTEAAMVLAGTVALAALIGHLYGVMPLTRLTVAASQMAVHTAVLFLFLSIATLWSVPEGWVAGLLRSEGPGGLVSRRLLPLTFGVLIVLGRLRLYGQEIGWYGTEFGLSIMVLSSILVLTGAILWCAGVLDRAEAARRREEEWRLAAEARLAATIEADRLKSRFLADMSHELRTPLNAIVGFTQLIHDGKVRPESPKYPGYLSDILASANHLLILINDVLDLARVESGKLELSPEPVELDRLADEVWSGLQGLSARKRIQIQTEIDPALGDLVLDPAKLKQVLYNYLSNALKFTPKAGSVTLRARSENSGFFRLEVEDTGIGIRNEDLSRLFQEFQQVHPKGTTDEPGTGLGLALTRRLVEAQGGTVGVHSTPGQGSVFYALLPRNCAEPIQSSPAGG